jgi:uncharacterized repeat protein (TIGR03803 family)
MPTQTLKRQSNQAIILRSAVLILLCAGTTIGSRAQTLTTLMSFDGTDGAVPYAGLVQGLDGNLYGTTSDGGTFGYGTVFKISPTGKLSAIYSFCKESYCTDGQYPQAGLVQGSDGTLYGTTPYGGPGGSGNIFGITPAGKLTTLHLFCLQKNGQGFCADGADPQAGLVLASDGNLYGVTATGGNGIGGTCAVYAGCGTIFRVTAQGKLTTLHSFCTRVNSQGYCVDGSTPVAALVQGVDGNLYGTTNLGGANNQGTVFAISTTGKLATLYSFCAVAGCADGANPKASLVQATNGKFYGTTLYGGTIFEITSSGKLTRLHAFCANSSCPDGSGPQAPLIQATDGNLYGTTAAGTIYAINESGQLATLHTFTYAQGEILSGALIQATNGSFYGTATWGGTNDEGTVFRLTKGLGPFVETLPNSGRVGSSVILLGSALAGSTSVSFNGAEAEFTVVSASEIKATVPPGATTGKVKVLTRCCTLLSGAPFRVTPQIIGFSPSSGAMSTEVDITGVSLTQATRVTFGGVAATTFKVDSDIQITAQVPVGAKSGTIAITTPGGTATSSAMFAVTQ